MNVWTFICSGHILAEMDAVMFVLCVTLWLVWIQYTSWSVFASRLSLCTFPSPLPPHPGRLLSSHHFHANFQSIPFASVQYLMKHQWNVSNHLLFAVKYFLFYLQKKAFLTRLSQTISCPFIMVENSINAVQTGLCFLLYICDVLR